MSEYKIIDDNHVLHVPTGAAISLKSQYGGAKKYRQWIAAGNIPAPRYTAAELKQQQVSAINSAADAAIEAIIPTVEGRARAQARVTELLARELRVTLTADEIAERDAIEAKWEAMKAIRVEQAADIAALG